MHREIEHQILDGRRSAVAEAAGKASERACDGRLSVGLMRREKKRLRRADVARSRILEFKCVKAPENGLHCARYGRFHHHRIAVA